MGHDASHTLILSSLQSSAAGRLVGQAAGKAKAQTGHVLEKLEDTRKAVYEKIIHVTVVSLQRFNTGIYILPQLLLGNSEPLLHLLNELEPRILALLRR